MNKSRLSKMNILFICLGNICRSPMAEGAMKKILEDLHITDLHHVDSCGFEAYHLGEPPHKMAQQTALKHHIDISAQRQRLFSPIDFDNFDRIFVMDSNNYKLVNQQKRTEEDMKKVDYLYNMINPTQNTPIPDPWGGTTKDFEHAFDMIWKACLKLGQNLLNQQSTQ